MHGRAAPASLADLGYVNFGIDEGWEDCKAGIGGSQHGPDGAPLVNTSRFPSLKALVDKGHAVGLQMGWYLAGCMCAEQVRSLCWCSCWWCVPCSYCC